MEKVRQIYHWFTHVSAALLIIGVGWFLFTHVEYYSVPNSDVFQYIDDGRDYFRGKLPLNIHAPPGNPVLLTLLAQVINHPRKEIVAAILINNISVVGMLVMLFLIAELTIPLLSLPILILTCLHPLIYKVGLDITSEALFGFVVLISLFLRLRQLPTIAALYAGFAFLVRYEGAVLLAAYVIIDLISVGFPRTLKNLGGILIIGIWLLIISTHNSHKNLAGNTFIQEVIYGSAGLSIFNFAKQLPTILPFTFPPHLADNIITPLLLVMFVLPLWSKITIFRMLSLFGLGYILMHSVFPAVIDRYFFPLIGITYLLIGFLLHQLISMHDRFRVVRYFLVTIVIIAFIYQSVVRAVTIPTYLTSIKYSHHEYRLLTDWINSTTFSRPIQFLVIEPWMVKYYSNNPKATFPYLPREYISNCKSLDCLISYIQRNHPESETIVVTDSYTSDPYSLNDYWPIQFGIRLYNDFENNSEKRNFKIIKTIEEHGSFFKAYQVISGNE